jgi:hypothetical protein
MKGRIQRPGHPDYGLPVALALSPLVHPLQSLARASSTLWDRDASMPLPPTLMRATPAAVDGSLSGQTRTLTAALLTSPNRNRAR